MELYQNAGDSSSFSVRPGVPNLPSLDGLPAVSGEREKRANSALLGKQHEVTKHAEADDSVFRRLERYELQRIAADLLQPFKTEKGQSPRVCKCLRVPRKAAVEVWQSTEHQKFFYGGLVICGSVWDCLPCATKISEKRRLEVKQAIDAWEAQGGSVHMLTLTFPHYEHQRTAPLLEKFGKARLHFKRSRSWKALSSSLHFVGSINRVEVTYGKNGAHIHCHELLFSKYQYLTMDSGCFYPTWAAACESAGLDAPSEEHGVAISTPRQMAEYVSKIGKESSKWSLELEMTKGHIKRGKIDGMTPFDLLRAFRDTGDCDFSDRFIEYTKAFKGKTQLKWSRGLRELVALDEEMTDEQVANEHDQDAHLFALVDLETWRIIRKKELRGQLIEVCNQGIEALEQFIKTIKGNYYDKQTI